MFAAFLCVIVLAACDPGQERNSSPGVTFMYQGIRLDLLQSSPVDSIRITDKNGQEVFYQVYRAVERKRLHVPLAWELGATYTLELQCNTATSITEIQAPKEVPAGAAVHFGLPYAGREEPFSLDGQRGTVQSAYSGVTGSIITGGLTLRHYAGGQADYHVEINLPAGLKPVEIPSDMRAEKYEGGHRLTVACSLNAPNQLKYYVFRVKLTTDTALTCKAQVVREVGSDRYQFERTVQLYPLSMPDIREKIEVTNISMPTSAHGLFDTKSQPDTLYFGPKFLRLMGRILGTASLPKNNWAPFTHQTIQLRNTGETPISVLVTSRITRQNSAEVPTAFLPPDHFTGKLKDRSVAVTATLHPDEPAKIIIPVFVGAAPQPGVYDRNISIFPMGNNQPILEQVLPLYISNTNITALCVTLASVLLSLGGLVFFIIKFKQIIAGMTVQHLVVISFFGAITFAGINVPLRIFNSLITALFGPFSVLLTGFFNDLVYFSIIVALLRLIPRPGVVTLVFLIRYLLSGMMLGGFHVLDFLFMGTSLVLKETALYASGITHPQKEFNWSFAGTFFAAILLGAADAGINASNIYLQMIFYRLYYADWYILLTIVFNGFVYTGIGVFFGRRFSGTLQMVQD